MKNISKESKTKFVNSLELLDLLQTKVAQYGNDDIFDTFNNYKKVLNKDIDSIEKESKKSEDKDVTTTINFVICIALFAIITFFIYFFLYFLGHDYKTLLYISGCTFMIIGILAVIIVFTVIGALINIS
jgi:hypothetical protein